jgi:hypothetical protein
MLTQPRKALFSLQQNAKATSRTEKAACLVPYKLQETGKYFSFNGGLFAIFNNISLASISPAKTQ